MSEPYTTCCGSDLMGVPLVEPDGIPAKDLTQVEILVGDAVTLIDVEAGIEHFGRGTEQHEDAVLVVVDPTFESLSIAERVGDLCHQMELADPWAILNKEHFEAAVAQNIAMVGGG